MKAKKSQRIVLTRQNNEPLASKLIELGAEVLELPLIDVELEANQDDADDVLSNMACYAWLVFSSANGVRGFFKEFFKKFKDIRCLGPCRIACIGLSTAKALDEFHIECDVIPEKSTSEEMAKAIMDFETIENLTILCVTGNLGDKACAKILEEKGRAIVDTFQVYKTSHKILDTSNEVVKDFTENGADVIFFASPSAVESFLKNAKTLTLKNGADHPKAYSIGEKTSEAMKKLGIPVAKEASHPDNIIALFSKAGA